MLRVQSAANGDLLAAVPGNRDRDGSITLFPQPPEERRAFFAGLVELLLVQGLTLGLSERRSVDDAVLPCELAERLFELGITNADLGGRDFTFIRERKLRTELGEAAFYAMWPIIVRQGAGGGVKLAESPQECWAYLEHIREKWRANRDVVRPLEDRLAGRRTDPVCPPSCAQHGRERAVLDALREGQRSADDLAEVLGWEKSKAGRRAVSKLVAHMRSEHAAPIRNGAQNVYVLATRRSSLQLGVEHLRAIGDGLFRRASAENDARALWWPADDTERARAQAQAVKRVERWRERDVVERAERAEYNARRTKQREAEVVNIARGVLAGLESIPEFEPLPPSHPGRASLSAYRLAQQHEYEAARAVVASADSRRTERVFVRLRPGVERPDWLPASMVRAPKARQLNSFGMRARRATKRRKVVHPGMDAGQRRRAASILGL